MSFVVQERISVNTFPINYRIAPKLCYKEIYGIIIIFFTYFRISRWWDFRFRCTVTITRNVHSDTGKYNYCYRYIIIVPIHIPTSFVRFVGTYCPVGCTLNSWKPSSSGFGQPRLPWYYAMWKSRGGNNSHGCSLETQDGRANIKYYRELRLNARFQKDFVRAMFTKFREKWKPDHLKICRFFDILKTVCWKYSRVSVTTIFILYSQV